MHNLASVGAYCVAYGGMGSPHVGSQTRQTNGKLRLPRLQLLARGKIPQPYWREVWNRGSTLKLIIRFFRDMIEFALYERRLKKNGVIVLSMTQQTSDDPAGEMARRIFSLFDEYQSKENAKHTLRAMKENARQGYFNGSTPPYGFRAVEVENTGNKGKKKRLVVDPTEAAIVNTIYRLYLDGNEGQVLGVKGIASYLNNRGLTMRGGKWRKTIISSILANRIYLGEYVFNKRNSHTLKIKPESEWITISLPPIVDVDTFQCAEKRRSERYAQNTPARIVNTPTLLTGLLKCGCCGSLMTIATGKGGRYRYYKCSSKIHSIGKKDCENSNIRMETLDKLVLQTVAETVFTPERVEVMMGQLKSHLKDAHSDQDQKIRHLSKELEEIKGQTDKLFEAVEKGFLPLNDSLHERVHKHEARKQEILIELARLKHERNARIEIQQEKCCSFLRGVKGNAPGQNVPFRKRIFKIAFG